jgi:hypothetical protein
MKTIIFISFFLTAFIAIHGQGQIINDSILKTGIYKSFEEFKCNKPSVDFKYKTLESKMEYESKKEFTFYKIDIEKKSAKAIGKVFGYCDGGTIFINEENPKLGPNTLFRKIEMYGKYSYFEDIINTPIITGQTTMVVNSLVSKLLNNETGEIIILNQKKLKEIINDDVELLTRFENEPKKDENIKKYIREYLDQ